MSEVYIELLGAHEVQIDLVRAELADAASPAPSLAPDGRLNAGPNSEYDVPVVDDDLPELPIRQRALIKILLSDLPGNAPKHLKTTLTSYDDELRARGVQPLLGLLKDMAAIIEASVGATGAAREWLAEGMQAAFQLFMENHALFIKYFPLDLRREELYARTSVDETSAAGLRLSAPFQDVADASLQANKAGLATDDFVKIVDKLAEYAKIIASLPVAPPTPTKQAVETNAELPPPIVVVTDDDRIMPPTPPVSAKKRMLLSGFGFFERAYNLLGSTATLTGAPEGNALLKVLHDAITNMLKLISP